MAWRSATLESLDDEHAAAAARASRLVAICSSAIGLAMERRRGEQFSRARDVVGTGGLGEQAIVAVALPVTLLICADEFRIGQNVALHCALDLRFCRAS